MKILNKNYKQSNLAKDKEALYLRAITDIVENAREHSCKRPAMSTLLEEMAEAVLSSRGKHDGPLELEITQIGGICINILWQLYDGLEEHVCDVGRK